MLWAAFTLGLAGSWHCVGMCGPIAMVVPGAKGKNRIYAILLYHSGKILSYALIGSLFGLFGLFLGSLKIQSVVTISVGILMVLIAFLPVILNRLEQKGFVLFSSYFRFKQKLSRLLDKDKVEFAFYIGLLNGFIPCGMVYMAALAALTQASVTDSILFMVLFGLGTAPFISLLIFFANYLRSKIQKRAVMLRTAVLFLVGLFMVWKGFNSYSLDLQSAKAGDHFQICEVIE